MIHKYYASAAVDLKTNYGIDVVDDILLGRKDRVLCYGDVSRPDAIDLHVIAGTLAFLGFADAPSIPFSRILAHFDADNKYAEVAGAKEYREYVEANLAKYASECDVTFPIRVAGKRKWLRTIIHPVPDHPTLCVFSFTDVTELLDGEEAIYEKTHKDPLTGLFNKYTFDYHYGLRYRNDDLHVLYLDIDDFKKINDQNGHVAGDACLRAFAQVLRGFERGYDRFYRLGGDEFVGMVFAPEEYVRAVAAQILVKTRQIRLPDPGKRVTVSIGVVRATIRDDVVRKADAVMYKAKAAGKNTCLYETE